MTMAEENPAKQAEPSSSDAEAKDELAPEESEDEKMSDDASEPTTVAEDPKEEVGEAEEAEADADSTEETAEEEPEKPSEPVVLGRGGRQRKSTESYKPAAETRKKEKVIPKGKGEKLEDMPRVVANFKDITWSDPHLKMLYNVVFGVGKKKEFKSHLLQFNGLVYPEGKEEDEKDRLKEKMYRLKMGELKAVMDLADVERSAESFGDKGKAPDKEKLCDRFLEWLEAPKASGKKLKSASKKSPGKRKSAGSAKGSAKKSKSKKSRRSKEDTPSKKAKRESTEEAAEKEIAAVSPPKAKESEAVNLDIPGADIKKVSEKVRSIVEKGDREKLTVKGIRKTLEEWLDIDLTPYKDGIRSLIMAVM